MMPFNVFRYPLADTSFRIFRFQMFFKFLVVRTVLSLKL